MKKLSFLALAAVGLLFGACSDKDVVAEESPLNNDNGGGNYIAIGINLPQANAGMTRAADGSSDNGGNVVYNDGMASEYAVNDAVLLVFDNAGKFKSAYNLSTTPWTDSGDNTENVTQYSTKVVQRVNSDVVGKPDASTIGDQLLVLLNTQGVVDPFVDGAASIKVGNKTITTSDDYDAFAEAQVTTTSLLQVPGTGELNSNGFFMANAPLSDKAGSATDYTGGAATADNVRILVPITQTYETQAAAYNGNADQIYVERALAKVTFDNSLPDNNDDKKLSASKIGGTTDLTWSVASWTLDNTNKKSFVVRSMDDDTDASFFNLKSNKTGSIFRFIGSQQITFPTTQTFGYRTYFAKDPNYEHVAAANIDANFNRVVAAKAAVLYADATEYNTAKGTSLDASAFAALSDAEKTKIPAVTATDFSTSFGDTHPQYCFENTFNVAGQQVNQTTLVQVAIQAINTTAQDLYTLGSNKTYVYTESTLKAFIIQKAYEYLTLNDAFNATAGTTASSDITDVTLTLTSNGQAGTDHIAKLEINENLKNHLKSEFFTTVNESGTNHYYLNITVADDASTADFDESVYGVGAGTERLINTITKYDDGISYYNIRIKHFGDNLTPWNNDEWSDADTGKPGGTNGIYPLVGTNETAKKLYQANNYLGRYGVLRNNWYDLKVNKVRMLGEATPHTNTWPDTPDDELDNYISFQINILSWAKHVTQAAEL